MNHTEQTEPARTRTASSGDGMSHMERMETARGVDIDVFTHGNCGLLIMGIAAKGVNVSINMDALEAKRVAELILRGVEVARKKAEATA